jgi:hypothetical protein
VRFSHLSRSFFHFGLSCIEGEITICEEDHFKEGAWERDPLRHSGHLNVVVKVECKIYYLPLRKYIPNTTRKHIVSSTRARRVPAAITLRILLGSFLVFTRSDRVASRLGATHILLLLLILLSVSKFSASTTMYQQIRHN